MKVKLLVFAAALLMLTSLSFGQFLVAFYSIDTPMMVNCDGTGGPIPDGTAIEIHWNRNNDGIADDNDPLVRVEDGFNFNTFYFNSSAIGMDAGYFANDPSLVGPPSDPIPNSFYLKIVTPGAIYRSRLLGPWALGPNEVYFGPNDWTCEIPPEPTCEATGDVNFADECGHPGERDLSAAITLCATDGPSAMVCVGPLCTTDEGVAAGRLPHVVLSYGAEGCDAPGSGWTWTDDYAGWTLRFIEGQGYFYCKPIEIGMGTEGCATLHFDFILAAQIGDVKVLPMDNAVSVKFNTLSETNMLRFEVRRDGNLVGKLDATNNPTGHEYSYVDNTVNNGTTYKYELVQVNMDGTQSVVATESATPSMENAVVTEYALHQNFPNPFNPTTSIRLDLVEKNFVTLKVYNATGQEVATVVNGERHAGVNIVNFDATNLTSGLYFYTVKVGNVYSATKKMLLVK